MKRLTLLTVACLISKIILCQTNIFPASGSVGIGTVTPQAFLNIIGTSATSVELHAEHYQNGYGATTMQFKRSRGTKAVPISLVTGDYMSALEGWGYSGSAFHRSSYIVNGTPTTTSIPTDLIFATCATEADATERMPG